MSVRRGLSDDVLKALEEGGPQTSAQLATRLGRDLFAWDITTVCSVLRKEGKIVVTSVAKGRQNVWGLNPNAELIVKADAALACLTENGGALDPLQAARLRMPLEIEALKAALFAASWERMVVFAALDQLTAGTEEIAYASVRRAQRFMRDVCRAWWEN